MTYPPPPPGEDGEEVPGDLFEGNLVNGVREGHGKYTWSNGCTFEGEYKGNMRNGRGLLLLLNGNSYDGDQHHNKQLQQPSEGCGNNKFTSTSGQTP